MRTDRQFWYFEGDQNPHLTVLNDILLTYAFFNFDLGKRVCMVWARACVCARMRVCVMYVSMIIISSVAISVFT